jgi:lysosomal acid lipase/cholesteryl ester hydrolase
MVLAGKFLTLPFYYLINYKFLNDYKKQVEKFGHKLEENEVTTEDGYILNLWHLVPNFDVSPDKVIFFQNGFAATGLSYFMLEEKSLPYLLYEKGYDIWIGNNRGIKISQNHVSKNSKKANSDYWDFSMDDFVKYDIQSQINYIKKRTNAKKVDFVGYSEDTTLFLMLYMDYPEFVESSIKTFISFGLVQNLPSVSPAVDNLIELLYNLF